MRSLAFIALFAACGTDVVQPSQPYAEQTFQFGPFVIQPDQEITDQCVQITLDNDQPLYVNQVHLVTGVGFHHSNWFFVPEHVFPGPNWDGTNSAADDGTYTCTDRSFDQATAAIFGGVIFAQSTQDPDDLQAFPEGVAVLIPPHSKLVSTIHLLNPGDNPVTLHPTISLLPIAKTSVVTLLSGMSFLNEALGLPPNAQSSFQVDCDLSPQWQTLYNQGQVTSAVPDFNIYYAMAHYHALGTGMTIEAVKPDNTATTIFTTVNKIGDTLGGELDPIFNMTGYSRIRFTCNYYNDTAATVWWGNGNQEMCVFLAFSDSTYLWGGGESVAEAPGDPTVVGDVMNYTAPCAVFADDASR